MMAEGAALVESMDWTAGSITEDGSAEAAGAENAIVRAAQLSCAACAAAPPTEPLQGPPKA